MVRCINCDTEYEHTDEVDHEEVDEIELVEQDDGPPRMQIGVDSRDVWRCKGCGKVLGVR